MPIPIDKIQVVEDEIERQHYDRDDHDGKRDDDDDENNRRHRHAMTPPEQDFSYLKHSNHGKRSVHYDIEQMNHYEHRLMRTTNDNEPPLENVLRRRFIAHWGLPGEWSSHFVREQNYQRSTLKSYLARMREKRSRSFVCWSTLRHIDDLLTSKNFRIT
jgi:hypothetical protein